MFIIIWFAVDSIYFHIYDITNSAGMRDLPSIFLDIDNVHLPLFLGGYKSPVYDWCEVEYHVSTKDILG